MRNFLTNFIFMIVGMLMVMTVLIIGVFTHMFVSVYIGPLATILADMVMLAAVFAGVLTFLQFLDN